MINNFRYSCPWEQFEEAVKILKNLIERKKAHWLIGFIKNIDLLVDESEDELSDEIEKIIDDEIIYLIRRTLTKKDVDEEGFKKSMRLSYPNASEEELDESAIIFFNKLELVKDTFNIDKLSIKYNVKKRLISHKLSGFDYNILTHNLSPDEEETKCALINISSQKSLEKNQKEEEVSFICDKDDIDILIHFLEIIKSYMEEC